MAYSETTADEIMEGINRIFGNRMPDVKHAPAHVIVGCSGSSSSAKVAPIGNLLRVPLVSWWAGSPALSNKLEFPYFLRTRGTSTGNGAGVVRLSNHFQWKRIGFIYELQAFHIGVYEGANQMAKAFSMVLQPFLLFHYPDVVDDNIWIGTMKDAAGTGLRVFGMSVMGPVSKNRAALQAARAAGLRGCVFIAALELQDFYPSHSAELRGDFNGMLGLDYSQDGMNDISRKFEDAWKAMNFTQMRALGISQGYVDSMTAKIPDVFTRSPFMQFQAYLFDAIMAVIIAYQKMMDQGADPNAVMYGQAYLDALYGLSFRGASGEVTFSPIVNGKGGDRLVSTFVVFNTQNGSVVTVGSLSSSLSLTGTVLFPDGGSDPRKYDPQLKCATGQVRVRDPASGEITCSPCLAGEESDVQQAVCLPCPRGFMSPTSGSMCTPCPAGAHQEQPGQSKCSDCLPGTYTEVQGLATCLECPAGHFTAGSAAVQCEPCRGGEAQPWAGQASCTRCDIGSFQDVTGATSCKLCPNPMVTDTRGAISLADCLCPAGTYRPLSSSSHAACLPCPLGLRCEVGSSLAAGSVTPRVVAGHYVEFKNTSEGAVMSVYVCKPAEACPGGPLAEEQRCADRRSGFLCTQCPTGTYPSGGSCKDCGGGSYAALVIVALLLLALLLLVTVIGGRMHPAAASPHTSAGLKTLTLAFMFLQTIGAVYNIGITWDDPFKAVCEAMSLLNFDIDTNDVINIGCAQFGGPLNIYVLKMVLPLVGIAGMFATWFALRALNIGNLSFDGVLNGVGSVLTIFYITQTVAAFSPHSCYTHPNGKRSMTWAPEVLCDTDSEHASMVGVSVFGIIAYPVTIFVVTAYAVLKFPYAVIANNLRFVTRFGFIFHRWTPDRYWFGSIILVRNFLVAVLPILIPKSDYKLAILLVEFVLLMMVCLLLVYKPWKLSILTVCDAGLNLGVLMLLAVGAVGGVSTAYSIVCTILFAGSAFFTGILLCRCAFQYIRGSTYDVFLSHHKKDGACGARLLKLRLSTKFTGGVFLDCDNLAFLGTLFDHVKQSKIVVVILSGATLSRPWCLGEIAQAVLSSIKMFPVTFLATMNGLISIGNDATPKTEQEISQMDGIATLYPFGISISAIHRGIAELLKRAPWLIPLNSTGGFENAVRGMCDEMSTLVAQTLMTRWVSYYFDKSQGDPPANDTVDPKTWLLTNHDSKEALAAAQVIKLLFQKMTLMEVVLDVGYSAATFLAAIVSGPSKGERPSVIFTLTEGTLTNAKQMVRGVLLRRHRRAHFIPVILGDSFAFPSQDFYDAFSKSGGPCGPTAAADLLEAAGEAVSPDDVAKTLQRIFASLAIVANVPGASEAMLKQIINTMIFRFASEGAHKDTTEEHEAVQQAAPAASDAPEPKEPAPTSATAAASPAEDPADSNTDEMSVWA